MFLLIPSHFQEGHRSQRPKNHYALCTLHTWPHCMWPVLFHKNRILNTQWHLSGNRKAISCIPGAVKGHLALRKLSWLRYVFHNRCHPGKRTQTSVQISLYKSTSRKWDSLRIFWTLINQTDTDLDQWKYNCLYISKAVCFNIPVLLAYV